MNLKPPPASDDIVELRKWCEELYEFLKYPAFHIINMVPRATCSDTTEGNIYYDSDDDKLKVRDSDSWNDTY
jgi:hypothetical protein